MRCPLSSRRQFLATSAVAFAATSLPKSLLAERTGGELFTSASLGAYAQGILTQATFEGLIGTLFMAFLDNNAVAYMRLVSVTGNSPSTGSAVKGSAATSLLRRPANTVNSVVSFQASFSTGGANFSQGSYLLDHGTLGRFACFLVPSDPMGGPTCSATFCYLASGIIAQPPRPTAPVELAPPVELTAPVELSAPVQSRPGMAVPATSSARMILD